MLSTNKTAILKVLSSGEEVRAIEIVRMVNISQTTVATNLTRLRKAGYVQRYIWRPGVIWPKSFYRITDAGLAALQDSERERMDKLAFVDLHESP